MSAANLPPHDSTPTPPALLFRQPLPPRRTCHLCRGQAPGLAAVRQAVDRVLLRLQIQWQSRGPAANTDLQLEALHKEIRLDFLTSMGEAERFKLLLDEMPHLRDKVEGDYLEARDRSSRLLGHLRAIEKTLKTLAASR